VDLREGFAVGKALAVKAGMKPALSFSLLRALALPPALGW
jgi:hypothetical protein